MKFEQALYLPTIQELREIVLGFLKVMWPRVVLFFDSNMGGSQMAYEGGRHDYTGRVRLLEIDLP